jgi:hypothetical protein
LKQINNGFDERYYLTEQGQVYNAETDKLLAGDRDDRYRLLLTNGKIKSITKGKLCELVYNKPLCEDDIKDLENEVWKVIPQTNNKYLVSNKGRVKSYCGKTAKIL